MARRARGQEEYTGPGRRPRRKSGNEGLYLALGAAAVVALIFVLMFSGGSGGDAEIKEASETLENFIDAILKNQQKRTMGMASLPGLLVDHDPVRLKERATMTPADWKKVENDIYRELWIKVKDQLRLNSTLDVSQKILAKGEATWDGFQKWVQIRWQSEGYDTVIAERKHYVKPAWWLARLQRIDGSWRVIKLAPER